MSRPRHTTLIESVVTSAPAVFPISLSDIKNWIKADFTADDDLLNDLIEAGTEWCQNYLCRALITQTRKAYYKSYGDYIHLPYSPIQSVTTVTQKRLNESNVLTNNSDYYINGVNDKFISIPGNYSAPGHSPADVTQDWQLEVLYVCGYGTSPDDVPEAIRHGIAQWVATSYLNRGENVVGAIVDTFPETTRKRLDLFRKISIETW